jgi:ATP-dependent DNA helicase RecQ
MDLLHKTLLRYWGHSAFRPLQQDIIESVIAGKDTMALLPTGGGKSVCFQVPGILREGLCLVISPLIALMKDQVENLRKKEIAAQAIYAGMHAREIDLILSEAVNGTLRFLYLSPERLLTESFLEHLQQMPVGTIAVDEAHCISQWGYDFRPPYLRIAEVRSYFPQVPVIALTATATPEVTADIMDKLAFRNGILFSKSFARENLIYLSIQEEDKYNRIIRICRKVAGTGIIYVRNRKATEEVAGFLGSKGISALAYHAGMTPEQRDQRQHDWISGSARVMVATNAFGMGIDKPDVRFVIHIDIPDTPEAYFQEAGRGGRDGEKSYAVLLFEKADILKARTSLRQAWPEVADIRMAYNALGNYFRLAVGSGRDCSFDFSLGDFATTMNRPPRDVYYCIKALEQQGYLTLSEGFLEPSRLMILTHAEDLYRFQVKNIRLDPFIRLILRSYAGIFSGFVKINEESLAARMKISVREVMQMLKFLEESGIIAYQPRKSLPQIYFVLARQDVAYLSFNNNDYLARKERAEQRLEVMISYATSDTKCRSLRLLEYFGEKGAQRCGFCDVCLKRNAVGLSTFEFDSVLEVIRPLLQQQPFTMAGLMERIPGIQEQKCLKVVQWLLENEKITWVGDKLIWSKRK